MDTVMVRVKKSTRDRLMAEARHLVALTEAGLIEDPGINPETINPAGCGLSLDQVINRLLDQVEGHRKRARKKRAEG